MTGQQLKNSILQLAIQGKLVPQIESEGTAEDLLKEIRAEKERLVKEGKLKKKDLEVKPIEDDEIPFEIPESWKWCRLGYILKTTSGSTPLTSNSAYYNGDVNWTRTTDLNNGYLSSCEKKVSLLAVSECNLSIIPRNSICIAMYGGAGTIGKYSLIKFDTTINQSVCAIHPNEKIYMEFIYYFMQYQRPLWMDFAVGSRKDPNINKIIINNCMIPLPPLSEQKRIVAKIEELMPMVEEYGKAQERLETLNRELPEKLKKSVLQEAIMGKLVPQDPKEGTAEELLAEIRKEKEKLVKEGKLKKKDLEVKPIEDDEIPFEIPEGWKWVRIGEFADIINGFTPLRTNAEFWTNGTVSWFTVDDIRDQGRRIKSTKQYINEKTLAKNTSRILPKHTLLICCTASVGEYALTEIPLTTNQQFNGIVIKNEYINLISPEYLFSIAPTFKDRLLDLAGKTTFNFVSVKKVSEMIIPLPPLSEQKRIVSKLEEVMEEIEGMK